MREWSLHAGDPLCLILAADTRLSKPNYINDHIWEMEIGSGEPRALSLHTTFGLRARSIRIYPRFTQGGDTLSEVSEFATPPIVRHFYPNFLELTFAPFEGLEVIYEVHVPDSITITGRVTLINRTNEKRNPRLEMCAALVPLDGHPFSHTQIQMVNVLVGQTTDLVPLLFLTGGALPGPGPQPSLMIDLDLNPGESRQLTWAQVASPKHQTSFDTARLIAAQPWDAERARIELVNVGDQIEIQTTDPDWDAALAFSQNAAHSLFFPGNDNLSHASYVQMRGPDQGHSRAGDGSDFPVTWIGQSPLETYYLSTLLPPTSKLKIGLLNNFLESQSDDGTIDDRPGLNGQRGGRQAMPILASLAWEIYKVTSDDDFLEAVFPKLLKFFWAWFSPQNDRDSDGIPEWSHLGQTGYDENPMFETWNPWSQGVDITSVRHPALLAMLYREADALRQIAKKLEQEKEVALVKKQVGILKTALDEAWNPRSSLYCYLDRESAKRVSGKVLARERGSGTFKLKLSFEHPIRLLIEIQSKNPGAQQPIISISEFTTKGENEVITGEQFQWRSGGMVATSQKLHEKIGRIRVKGTNPNDKIIVYRLDNTFEDHTLLLPLWAGIPNKQQARVLIAGSIKDAGRFDRPFGIPASLRKPTLDSDSAILSVHLPWNQLIGEGLLTYGFRKEAAHLVAHLMNAVIQNLKQKRAFYQRYHAETGQGIGERNALSGLAPVGLFLQVLGVQILSPSRVRLEGKNPFPWPVTIKYRGLTILRKLDDTDVIFPNGKRVHVIESNPLIVSMS